jgi:hypothetical protein
MVIGSKGTKGTKGTKGAREGVLLARAFGSWRYP